MSQKNIAHSIFQRLLNRAKANKEEFNLLLSRYGMERFLYRLIWWKKGDVVDWVYLLAGLCHFKEWLWLP